MTIKLILNEGLHVLMSRVADRNIIRSTRDQAKQLQITVDKC
ncbi:unnamed protein product [marine sediment metagenome]|uniref:Uncharacterized protein n=1 Tax=marine sediment metagenome TaxID=412755 RepID=X1IUV8_9ZZZZ